MFFKKKIAIPTVAAALAGFHQVVADLKAAKEHHDGETVKHAGIIERTEQRAKEMIEGITRSAETIKANAAAAIEVAENEAREAAKAIARVESFLGL